MHSTGRSLATTPSSTSAEDEPAALHRRQSTTTAEPSLRGREVLRVRDRLARLGGQRSQNGWDAMPSTDGSKSRGST